MSPVKTMKRLSLALATAALAVAVFAPSGASASFSCFEDPLTDPQPGSQPGFGIAPGCFDGSVLGGPSGSETFPTTDPGGSYAQAGGHPYSVGVSFDFNLRTRKAQAGPASAPIIGDIPWPAEPARDVLVDSPPGLVGNPTAVGQCTSAQLATVPGGYSGAPLCPAASQVGTVGLRSPNPFFLEGDTEFFNFPGNPLYNMVPPPGVPARFGFIFSGAIVTMDAELRPEGDYGFTIASRNISEGLALTGVDVSLWGAPADPAHDAERWCPGEGGPSCPTSAEPEAFLTLPTACTAPGEGIKTTLRADSWFNPGVFKEASFTSHDPPYYPEPPGSTQRGVEGCEKVPFESLPLGNLSKPSLTAVPTALDAETPSGLEVEVTPPENPGLVDPKGIASSTIESVQVALPKGMTINPSQAEGLGACTPEQLASTELSFFPTPGKGCPDDSKIGSVEVHTPLLEETIPGDVYVAAPFDNPFGSLLAIYIVLEEPERGILVKLPGKVELESPSHPNQILTSFENLPQLPFSSFEFKFREGARAPLATPPTCGNYETEAVFTPHSDPSHEVTSTSSFQITRGIGGSPCPSGGVPGFNPGFSAGTTNNNAGSFSPFNMRLTRLDGEQNLTKFSAVLPPGALAKLAGVQKCSDQAIAQAASKARTGRQELASPSCPANSKIGRTLAGAGVGSVLTYVPGSLYLAGPYNGAPLSVVAITPAVAGPFDVGTVVVREALDLDPKTAVASVDGAASDPIPHILKGIPLKLRDLRVYVDRENFTLNPTSCDPSQVGATLWGSFIDVFSPADDAPVGREARFQAANCSSLGFKPALKINLKGGTKRGGHPALKAIVTPRPGDANIGAAVVKLPRSAFLDQAHIRTICTRVQFAAEACPPASAYGKVKAWSPLLDEPLSGPVYLRSSNNKLPDLVFDLDGLVDIEVAGRIDSIKGGIRASFEDVPDAPVSKLVLEMQGGRKGLIQNSRNLCASTNRADAKFDGQNGKARDFRPVVRSTNCATQRKAK